MRSPRTGSDSDCGQATKIHRTGSSSCGKTPRAGSRVDADEVTEVLDDVIDPWLARRWWHALMANAVRLVEDAALLATRGSCGRAQALAVLSAEELERAHHLYSAAEREWSKPIEFYSALDGPSEPIAVPDEAYPTDEPVWPRHRAVDLYAEGVVELWVLYRPGVHS